MKITCGAIGEGIGFAGLCFSAAWLEVYGKPAGGLWVIVFFWWLLGSIGRDSGK